MLSFAIPGTVIGVSYILAFNAPPIEITGTGLILVISFYFPEHAGGVRGRIASMTTQIDKSLDESSTNTRSLDMGNASTRDNAAPKISDSCGAGLLVRASNDRYFGGNLPGVCRIRHGHKLYHWARENNDYGLAIAYSTT